MMEIAELQETGISGNSTCVIWLHTRVVTIIGLLLFGWIYMPLFFIWWEDLKKVIWSLLGVDEVMNMLFIFLNTFIIW